MHRFCLHAAMTDDIEKLTQELREGWLELRAKVQKRAENLLGDEGAAVFLHCGKVFGPGGFAGMYVNTLLCSVSGCCYVMSLLDALERGERVSVAIISDSGQPTLTTISITDIRK